jgi:multiple sugar transport system substrate-binding protein
MQQGHVFMGLLWSDPSSFLEDPAVSKVAGKIGYSLIPSLSSKSFNQLEGLTYLIPKESKHPREPYRFMEWAMSAQVQVPQTLHGGGSTRKSAYDDPGVREAPYTSTFLASIPIAKEKPTLPESPQMTEPCKGVFSKLSAALSPHGRGWVALQSICNTCSRKSRLRYPVPGAR